jgi:CheY-like chemotaxis protein
MDQPAPAEHSLPLIKPHVLVVEDVETTRRRIVETLRANGYHVDEAVDGRDALRKASGTRFDAILLDLIMPNVDGYEFRATQLRHPQLANIPTVVVTAGTLRERDRYALGIKQILNKPFEDDVLLAAMSHACRRITALNDPVADPTSRLYWSRHGEVACWTHAPRSDATRWHVEQWKVIPETFRRPRRVYECHLCAGRLGPVERQER